MQTHSRGKTRAKREAILRLISGVCDRFSSTYPYAVACAVAVDCAAQLSDLDFFHG